LPGGDPRNKKLFDFVSFAISFEVLLDKKWQKRDGPTERGGKHVTRMNVAKRGEDFQQTLVELHLIFHLSLGFQPVLQQLQALDGVDGMHCALQRKMHVIHLEQQNNLIENA
jgi:hypothetical protein